MRFSFGSAGSSSKYSAVSVGGSSGGVSINGVRLPPGTYGSIVQTSEGTFIDGVPIEEVVSGVKRPVVRRSILERIPAKASVTEIHAEDGVNRLSVKMGEALAPAALPMARVVDEPKAVPVATAVEAGVLVEVDAQSRTLSQEELNAAELFKVEDGILRLKAVHGVNASATIILPANAAPLDRIDARVRGDTAVAGVSVKTLKVRTVSGSAHFTGVRSWRTSIETVSGDVGFDGHTFEAGNGSHFVQTVSGAISGSDANFGENGEGDATFKSVSGSIRIGLAADAPAVNVRTNTVSGRAKVAEGGKSTKKGATEVFLESVSGSLSFI